IRLGKVAVIVRLLLGAHAVSLAFRSVVEARFLLDLAARLDHLLVALDLVFQRLADEAEGIDVLHFCLGAELRLPARTDADVRIATQRTFFHVAVADAGVEDDLLQPGQIFVRFVRRRNVGLTNDLDQRHTGTVQVDGRPLAAVVQAVVQALAGVFLQVNARDTDALGPVRRLDLDVSVLGERFVVLRDLIALGQVRIEVILAREDGRFVDLAIQRRRRQHRKLHRPLVQHRQRPRQAEAHWTYVRVWQIAEARRAAAEDLRRGQELDVYFQSNDRLILGARGNRGFRRGGHGLRL